MPINPDESKHATVVKIIVSIISILFFIDYYLYFNELAQNTAPKHLQNYYFYQRDTYLLKKNINKPTFIILQRHCNGHP